MVCKEKNFPVEFNKKIISQLDNEAVGQVDFANVLEGLSAACPDDRLSLEDGLKRLNCIFKIQLSKENNKLEIDETLNNTKKTDIQTIDEIETSNTIIPSFSDKPFIINTPLQKSTSSIINKSKLSAKQNTLEGGKINNYIVNNIQSKPNQSVISKFSNPSLSFWQRHKLKIVAATFFILTCAAVAAIMTTPLGWALLGLGAGIATIGGIATAVGMGIGIGLSITVISIGIASTIDYISKKNSSIVNSNPVIGPPIKPIRRKSSSSHLNFVASGLINKNISPRPNSSYSSPGKKNQSYEPTSQTQNQDAATVIQEIDVNQHQLNNSIKNTQ